MLVTTFLYFVEQIFKKSAYFLNILKKMKWNDSYVQLNLLSKTSEGLQKPQLIFVLKYCIFKSYRSS